MKVLFPITNGFEEIEAATTLDVLRRAGIETVTAGMPSSMLIGSRGLHIKTDRKFEDVKNQDFDALVLVGGDPGYKNLQQSQDLLKTILDYDEKKKTIAAICAAPTVLAKAGILANRAATVYPGMERDIPRPRNKKTVVDGNIITSQGPGTAIEFALTIVQVLKGEEISKKVRRSLIC